MNERTRLYRYIGNCTNLDNRTGEVIAMIDAARDICRGTFARYADPGDRRRLEHSLGYVLWPERGLRVTQDRYVRYQRSRYKGKRVVILLHSAIEYVFQEEA